MDIFIQPLHNAGRLRFGPPPTDTRLDAHPEAMDHSFETDINVMRPLYAHVLTSSDCELSEHGSVTPSPSSLEPALTLGPTTPVMKDRSNSLLNRSPVSTLAASVTEGTPEWYSKKLQDKTISNEQLTALQSILKSKDARYGTCEYVLRTSYINDMRYAAGSVIS